MSQDSLAKVKGVCDIVFLLDISGSMQPCLDGLVDNIASFVMTLKDGADANTPSVISDWRIKICGYRDAELDGSDWWEESPFIANDVNKVTESLKTLQAKGGGDEPESLLDGIFKVATLPVAEKGAQPEGDKWRDRNEAARIVIVFTDATYKPTMSIPEAAGGTLDDIVNKVTEMKLKLCCFVPEGQECYYSLAEIDKTELEEIPGLLGKREMMIEYTQDKAHFQKVMEQLAKTVSKSAAQDAVAL